MLRKVLFVATIVFVLPLEGFGFLNIDTFEIKNNDSVVCYNESQPELACLEATIQEGSWVDYSTASVYEFHAYGLVDVISETIDGNFVYDSYHWTVENCEGQAAVVLHHPKTGVSNCIPVEAIRGGLISTNLDAGNTTLSRVPEVDLESKEAMLINSWTFGDVETKEDAYLSYDFKADGTYSRTVGNLRAELKEQGIWELSKDGQFIIFYATRNGSAETTYKTSVAKVIEYSQEGLVIETSTEDMDLVGFYGTSSNNFNLTRSHVVK